MGKLYDGNLASLNPELMFVTNVLNLESLHYGYWDGPQNLDLENLKKAQERYTDTLTDHFPDNVKTILDVGCGIGDVALSLVNKGYEVTAISPDKNHAQYYDSIEKERINFHNVKFEDLNLDEKFDLIIMIESQNYFDPVVGFAQCRRFLNPGGSVYISGMFRKGDSDIFQVCNIEDEYIQKASNAGFLLVNSLDITENILPTMTMAFQAYQGFMELLKATIDYHFDNSFRRKIFLLRMVFFKEFRKLFRLQEYHQTRMDPQVFQEHVKYMRLLFTDS